MLSLRLHSIITFMLFFIISICNADTYWNGSTYFTEIKGGNSQNYLQKAKYAMYIPNNVETIKGILIHQHGCGAEGSGEPIVTDAQYQAFANTWHLAIIAPDLYPNQGKNCYDWVQPQDGSAQSLLAGIDSLASQSGHPELKSAPWLLWGHSGGGHWALSMTNLFPEKVIATFVYSPALNIPIEYSEKAAKVPIMIRHAGAFDYNGPGGDCWNTALNTFAKIRKMNGNISIAYTPNQNHNYSFVRYMAIPFFESILSLRLPESGTILKNIDANTGFLVDTSTSGKPNIFKASLFTGNALAKSWLPDTLCAIKFQEFIVSGTIKDITPPSAPIKVQAQTNGLSTIAINWKAHADRESGIKHFNIYLNDIKVATYPEQSYYQYFDTNSDKPIPTEQPAMNYTIYNANLKNTNTIAISTVNHADLESAKTTISVITVQSDDHKSFYVSSAGNDANSGTKDAPFLTINKAKKEIRKINKSIDKDIVVFIMNGMYIIDSTLIFDYDDSGFNGHTIRYQAFDCQKPIISGGKRIKNWVLHDASKNIYKAFIDSSFDTRQLYINGHRAIRARSIDAEGWKETSNGYSSPINISSWSNISNIEIVARNEWKHHRGLIDSVNGNSIIMSQPYWTNVHKQFDAPPVWIENAYELLDADDEWYLDKKTGIIYVKCKANEDIQQAEIIAPKLELLMRCSGLQNTEFNGITFSHATWLQPNSQFGYPVVQADVRFDNTTWVQNPGNIILEYCRNVNFLHSTFEHLGGTALQLYFGCKNNTIFNNTFKDISGSAIAIGSIMSFSLSENDMVKDNRVEHNLIRDIGIEYESSVGVFTPISENTIINSNTLIQLPYTGISVGWGWNNQLIPGRNIQVKNNRIDSIMTKLKDGGGIYTIGSLPGADISYNYISNVLNGFGALYPDLGSSNMRWHHNVIKNVKCWLSLWSDQCLKDTVENNYSDTQVSAINGTNCIIRNNEFIVNDKWNQEALDIMSNAGQKTNISSQLPIIISQFTDTIIEQGKSIIYTVDISNAAGFSIQYKWYKNGTVLNKYNDSVLVIQAIDTTINGIYRCDIISDCGIVQSKSFSVKLKEIPSSIMNAQNIHEVIYPNPATNIIRISQYSIGLDIDKNQVIDIYDSYGRIYHLKPRNDNSCEYREFDISSMPNGVYFIPIHNSSRKETLSFIIMK